MCRNFPGQQAPQHDSRYATYKKLEGDLASLGIERDGVAGAIHAMLLGATFDGTPVNRWAAQWLLQAGGAILRQAGVLAK